MRVPFPWEIKGQIPTFCQEREEPLLCQCTSCFPVPAAGSGSLVHFHPQIRAAQHLLP